MSDNGPRYLYAILSSGGRWRVITSTEPINGMCIQLTPVEEYPVSVTYKRADGLQGPLSTHTVVCNDSCELGKLLNEIGKCSESHILTRIWKYDAYDPNQAQISQHFWRQLPLSKVYLVEDESGEWSVRCTTMRNPPNNKYSLFLSVIERYPVSITYSSSDVQGSSNFREFKAKDEESLVKNLNELLFEERDSFLLHSFGNFSSDSLLGLHVWNLIDDGDRKSESEYDEHRNTLRNAVEDGLLDFDTLFEMKSSEIGNLAESLALAMIGKDSDLDRYPLPASLKYEIAACVENLLAEKGIYYCFPQYAFGRVPCYQAGICGNPACPFRDPVPDGEAI